MVLPIESATLDRNIVSEAVSVTFERRRTHLLPKALPPPPTEWQKPYEALARECNLSGKTEDAFETLRTFAELIARTQTQLAGPDNVPPIGFGQCSEMGEINLVPIRRDLVLSFL
jgi:hypothetical protein